MNSVVHSVSKHSLDNVSTLSLTRGLKQSWKNEKKRSTQKWLGKRRGCLRKVLIIAGVLIENILVFGYVWSLMGGGRLREVVAHGGLTVVALRYVYGLL